MGAPEAFRREKFDLVGLSHSEDRFCGARLGAHLGMQQRTLALEGRSERLGMAVTRLSCMFDERGRTTSTPQQDAYSITLAMNPLHRHERWKAGRHVFGDSFAAGTVSVVDLREPVEVVVCGPVQAIQFYVPHRALEEFAEQVGANPIATLKFDRTLPDPILISIAQIFAQAEYDGEARNTLFLDQLALSLLAHFATTYGAMHQARKPTGVLAGWQKRRALEVMQAQLADSISIADVARECRLTPSHFARAFRSTMGQAPHQYLTQIRLERARELMLASPLQLVDIAILCGFSDQSHFTRVFTRRIGISPGSWRRSNQMCVQGSHFPIPSASAFAS